MAPKTNEKLTFRSDEEMSLMNELHFSFSLNRVLKILKVRECDVDRIPVAYARKTVKNVFRKVARQTEVTNIMIQYIFLQKNWAIRRSWSRVGGGAVWRSRANTYLLL